jgi:F0F1-type ATP synthase assembly protein I
MASTRTYSILLRAVVGGIAGLLFGMLLMTLEHTAPKLVEILGAPAFWLFGLWHSLGFPPQSEAALAGPFFAFFIQGIILGLIIGALSGCRRASTPPH